MSINSYATLLTDFADNTTQSITFSDVRSLIESSPGPYLQLSRSNLTATKSITTQGTWTSHDWGFDTSAMEGDFTATTLTNGAFELDDATLNGIYLFTFSVGMTYVGGTGSWQLQFADVEWVFPHQHFTMQASGLVTLETGTIYNPKVKTYGSGTALTVQSPHLTVVRIGA